MVIANATPGRHPALARQITEDGGRMYTFGDPPETFYSVTTIIGGGVPKYLHAHYAKMVAELVVADLERPHSRAGAIVRRWERAGRAWVAERQAAGELTSIKPAERLPAAECVLRWLKGAPERHRDEAATRGSAVHAAAEDLVLVHAREASQLILERRPLPAWPEQIRPWMEHSFVPFVRDFRPEYLAAEASVFNRAQVYAGTLDAVMRIRIPEGVHLPPGVVLPPDRILSVVVDYKSGRAIYADVALQLAALARGEFFGMPDGRTEVAMLAIDAGAVLHLTPTGYQLRFVRIDDDVFAAFLYAREVFRWATETSKSVLLDVLEPAVEGAA